MPPDPKKDFNAETLLNEHGKDVSGLGEKVSKCYSSERYEDFQTAVKKISIDVIGSEEGRTKIKIHAKESAKEYNDEQGWNKKNFWVPNLTQIIIGLISLAALAVAILKK